MGTKSTRCSWSEKEDADKVQNFYKGGGNPIKYYLYDKSTFRCALEKDDCLGYDDISLRY